MHDLPSRFGIARERVARLEIVTVTGDLDVSTAHHVGKALRDASRSGTPVVVDLGGCSFVDSTGIGLLLRFQRAADSACCRVAWVAPADPSLVRLLALMGMTRVLDLHGTLDAAMGAAAAAA